MSRLIKCKYPVIVEGKYDKITLQNVISALIIPTNGFSLFKDKEKCSLIRSLYKKSGGIVLLTDSDNAGNMIRAYLKNIIGNDKNIINVYIPNIRGKEKRKVKPSKEGFLGVEGVSIEILTDAFKKSGICDEISIKEKEISKTDLYNFGLSGKADSAYKRKLFLKHLSLPQNLSSNAFFDIINTYFTYEEFEKELVKWQNEAGKS